MKFFFSDARARLQDIQIDYSIYRTGCFRLLWCSKYGKSNNLEFYKGINYEYKDEKQLWMDRLICNISEDHILVPYKVPLEQTKVIKKKITKIIKTKSGEIKNIINKTFVPVELLKRYLDILDKKQA